MQKKKNLAIFFACIILAAALAGCKETPRLPPTEENMTLVTTTARTSSTYTGTTVEYIPTSTTAERRGNAFDMPDMPEIDMQGRDNPFGSEFYALFGGGDYPDYSVSPEDDSGENLPSSETSAPFAEQTEISLSREDIPEEAMTNITGITDSAVKVETAFPGGSMPDYTFSYPAVTTAPAEDSLPADTAVCGTFPQTEGFDIREYMPQPEDFPNFGDIEFDRADPFAG